VPSLNTRLSFNRLNASSDSTAFVTHHAWLWLLNPTRRNLQYFFELFNVTKNATQAHAATGTTYNTSEGETIFTSFELSKDWVWTLSMGVKGDPTRLSTVVADKPFMGLLPESQTKSWSEDIYSKAWSNTCWELCASCAIPSVRASLKLPQSPFTLSV
jgi:hypothetical protein